MAASKSMITRKRAEMHGDILFSKDLLLQQPDPTEIRGFDDYLAYARRLKAVLAPHVKALLAQGLSVVLDFPANVPAQRAWFRELIAASGADHLMHFVDTGHDRCIEQLRQRNREQPPGSMPMSVEQFEAISALFVPPAEEEGFRIQRHR